jgi:hypothetical protein
VRLRLIDGTELTKLVVRYNVGVHVGAASVPLQIVGLRGGQLRVGQLVLRQFGAEGIPADGGHRAPERVRSHPREVFR